MSIFSIKVKTKSGNDIKKKETFTVFFRIRYKKNYFTGQKTAEFTYRIMYSGGIIDPKEVLSLKDSNSVNGIEDLTLKVMLNFCHLLGKLSQKKDINPDFILFMSPDFHSRKNRSWMFLQDVFRRKGVNDSPTNSFMPISSLSGLEFNWTEEQCTKTGILKSELDMLREFVELNPNAVIMCKDPNKDPVKYAKSITICSMLQDRMDGKVQVEEI